MATLSEILLKLTKRMYSTGLAFLIPASSSIETMHIALNVSEEEAFVAATSGILDTILADNDNFTVDDAADWERRLNILASPLTSLEDRKLAILRKYATPGLIPARQHFLYQQGQLRAAGFDVYVHENRPVVQVPSDFAFYTGLAPVQLGQSQLGQKVLGQQTINIVANSIDENKDAQFSIGPDFAATYFIGGIVKGNAAVVENDRKDEFRQLILSLKPVQNVAILFINYGKNIWIQVGNDLNIAGVGFPAIASLTSARIAFIDSLNEDLRTYDFDGIDWVQVGNDLNIAGAGNPAITSLSSSRIAFIDTTNDDLRTYDFDGSDWVQVGNDLNIVGVGTPAIASLSSSRIAFIDELNQDLRTYDFDGSDWVQVGNDLNIAGVGFPAIASLTSARIAFIDSLNEDLRTYDFDGSDWVQVGNDLNIVGVGLLSMASLTNTRIAFMDSLNEDLQTYDFDGTDWAQVGNDLNIAGAGNPAIAALSSSRIAFIDTTNDDLRTYDFIT